MQVFSLKRMKSNLLIIWSALTLAVNANAQKSVKLDFVSEGIGVYPKVSDLLLVDTFPHITPLTMIHSTIQESSTRFNLLSGTNLGYSSQISSAEIPVYLSFTNIALGLKFRGYSRAFSYTDYDARMTGFSDISLCLMTYRKKIDGLSWLAALFMQAPNKNFYAVDNNYLLPLSTGSFDRILYCNLLLPVNKSEFQLVGWYRMNGAVRLLFKGQNPTDSSRDITTHYRFDFGDVFGTKLRYGYQFSSRVQVFSSIGFKSLGEGKCEWQREESNRNQVRGEYSFAEPVTILPVSIGLKYNLNTHHIVSLSGEWSFEDEKDKQETLNSRGPGVFVGYVYHMSINR